MPSEPDQFASDEGADFSETPDGDATVSNLVQELTWALVDNVMTDDELRLLENLLLSDDDARETYLGCIQLHVDLHTHFGKPPAQLDESVFTETPVLGSLGSDPSSLSTDQPAAGDLPS